MRIGSTYLTAKDVYNLSKTAKSNLLEKGNILALVNSIAKQGDNQIEVPLYPETVTFLNSLGYKLALSKDTIRFYTISWGNE